MGKAETVEHFRGEPQRGGRRFGCGTLIIVFCVLLGTCVVGGFVEIIYIMCTAVRTDQIDLVVENKSIQSAYNVSFSNLCIPLVKAGKRAMASECRGTFGPALLRLEHDKRRFEGTIGVLVDDDGPHTIRVTITNEGVEATHSYNEGTVPIAMRVLETK